MAAGLNHDGSILFLSCDLQNSTQFKQKREGRWIATFLSFYSEFPSLLANRITESYPGLRNRLSLWKAIGDELIFSVRIQSERECSDAIDAWMATLLEFEIQHLIEKTTMTLKGGAFLATVPSPDRRVAIPRTVQIADDRTQIDVEETNEATLNTAGATDDFAINFAMDFVGPSIDTGFRVLKFAARSYFVLTVEVAHLLFKHYNDDSTKRDRVAYLLGTHSLKGVWGGRPYPVFAIARPLQSTTPEQVLAKAFGDGDNPGLVTDEYPYRTPSQVLAAIEAYRSTDTWPGAIHAPAAHAPDFKNHQPVIDVRQHLDNLNDTSEDPLDTTEDRGEEDAVGDDLPRD
ncbi:hypothetical protein ORI20_32515 [Mycobacterium sp. CVI_P3]|uniref:Uncharacterized protein n=1 Tax=Mycobacterium pinniadriaticum TaxID=2994102 RepID=A0ABT3SQE2_9MYCO|nr:hypothetical protein [Mycobacterium pinniadriaticum]MCX2934987.1 hypothetical protein [Mycobacterium pinniadriaticum]MCX2941409.1 hypothetical protein [Mycobacterium pinniadriaticum]